MIGFEYYNPAKIVFGEDSEKSLKGLLEKYKVNFLKQWGAYARI